MDNDFEKISAKVRASKAYREAVENEISEQARQIAERDGEEAAKEYSELMSERLFQDEIADAELLVDSARREEERDSMAKSHPVGFLQVPESLDELPLLSFSKEQFVAPKTIDLRDYCLPPTDQGSLPECAGHAASAWAANILWRKNGVPKRIEPHWIYTEAKKIDGNPSTDGTSLTAVLQVLLNSRVFDPAICHIRILRNIEQVRFGLHKFGALLLGLNISKEWYSCNMNKPSVYGQFDTNLIGGHAVVAAGCTRKVVHILNSWGGKFGYYGFVDVTWEELARQMIYGAVLDNCLNDMRMK